MADKAEGPGGQGAAPPLLIKRYASRRLYNTETSDYVTLDDIARVIRSGREVRIVASRDAWRGFFRFEVVDLKHRRFDGQMSPTITREILHIPEAAAVLPYDPVIDSIVRSSRRVVAVLSR